MQAGTKLSLSALQNPSYHTLFESPHIYSQLGYYLITPLF